MTDDLTTEQLEAEERALASALADFEHQARRLRDGLERSGGRSFVLEAELAQLEQNLELTRRDLDQIRAKIKCQ